MLLEWAVAYKDWFYTSIVNDTWAWAIFYMSVGAFIGGGSVREYFMERKGIKS